MADQPNVADLLRTIEEMRISAEASATRERAIRDRERARDDREAEKDAAYTALHMTVDVIPKNAAEYMHPELPPPVEAIILPPIIVCFFELKPPFIQLMRANPFQGLTTMFECPIRHMGLFTALFDTIASAEVPSDYIRLKAFGFSIDGRAALWFNTLPAKSIFTWKQLYDLFLNKFFPVWKTEEIRTEINAFCQNMGKSLCEV